MKKIFLFLYFILNFFYETTLSNEKILNIYNWYAYIPLSVVHLFEKETGIHINYSEYDSNEMMYAKLKINPHTGYDLVFPSSYYVHRMIKEDMLHPLNLARIPNIQYINPQLRHKAYDVNNQFSIPFVFGITGIVVNDRFVDPRSVRTCDELWNDQYKNQLLILDDAREIFSIALLTLSYSVNERNPEHIHQAYQKLQKLMKNVKIFNSDAEQNIYIDEDAWIGFGWNGEIYRAQEENPHLHFIFPYPHFTLWIDCVAIPKYAPHVDNAQKFINFINQPKIAAQIASYNGFSSPNQASLAFQSKKMQKSNILNPKPEVLKRGVLEEDLGSINALYERYWELLKLNPSF